MNAIQFVDGMCEIGFTAVDWKQKTYYVCPLQYDPESGLVANYVLVRYDPATMTTRIGEFDVIHDPGLGLIAFEIRGERYDPVPGTNIETNRATIFSLIKKFIENLG